jgi:hypothetical protein
LLKRDWWLDPEQDAILLGLDTAIAGSGLSREAFERKKAAAFRLPNSLPSEMRSAERHLTQNGVLPAVVRQERRLDAADPARCRFVHLHDEAPVIGSGQHRVEVVAEHDTHVVLRSASGDHRPTVKLSAEIWRAILRETERREALQAAWRARRIAGTQVR